MMYPAFSQSVTLLRSAYPWQQTDYLLNSRTAPEMKTRRPGTRSYNYSFRYGTLFSRSGNNRSRVPIARTGEHCEEQVPKTLDAQSLGSAKFSNSDTTASNGSVISETASPSEMGDTTVHAKPTANRAKDDKGASRSFSFHIPLLGTIQVPGSLVLMIVPCLWASYSIVIKVLYRLPWSLNAALFNFLRLIISSVILLPAFTRKTVTKPIIVAGVELGFWTVLANILQIIGLRYTTASRGAFLGQLQTVLVPLIAVAVGMENRLAKSIMISAPLSVLGVALLTLDGATPSPIGDSIMIGTAFVAAFYVLRSKQYSHLPTKTLVAAKSIFQTLFAGIFYVLTTSAQPLSFVGATPLCLAINVGLLIWCGYVVGYASTSLQISGQSLVPASQASVIFTTNPLWAALMAIPLGERFGPKGFAGASIILLATALSSGIGFREKPKKKVGEVA